MTRVKLIVILSVTCAFLMATFVTAQPKPAQQLYVVTYVDVYPNFAADTSALLKKFAADSLKEPGCVRVEILQDVSRMNHFSVVEVWKTRADYETHLAGPNNRPMRDKLQPWMGSPFDERLYYVAP